MTTYVHRDGILVEKTPAPPPSGAFSYVPDIAPFATNAATDAPVLISGRRQLREFEQRHGIRQIGDQARPQGRSHD